VTHASVGDRRDFGRARRSVISRAALGSFAPAQQRPDPVALLESQGRSRIAELLPIRYGRMLASPFAFYRGAALIMAADLAAAEHTGLNVQLCGDAHLSNFGLFASPERNLVFDINDFDETLPGPWEWDVKRLLTSLAIASRDKGFGQADRAQVVRTAARAYRERMAGLAGMRELDVWYSATEINQELEARVDTKYARAIRRTAAKARTRDNLQALSKLTETREGQRRIASDPPLLIPIGELVGQQQAAQHERDMSALIDAYRDSLDPSRYALVSRFRYAGMARKVVGIGSVGARAWVVLMLGRDDNDPLLMQVKEAQPSVFEQFLGSSGYSNNGQRVVIGQRLMQATSDVMLGWLHCVGPDGHEGDYYVRQLRDWKQTPSIDSNAPHLLADYARSCGEVLARAHARSGDRVAIAAYLGRGEAADIALSGFAEAYADQNENDYVALQRAVVSGRIVADTSL
jgi:uncharacterized protein (DUF2252 family)